MTVFESLQLWLGEILRDPQNGFPGRYNIEAEFLPAKTGIYNPIAIMSNPNDTVERLMGGQVRHTCFKTLYITRDFLNSEARINNEAFLESLTKLIYKKNRSFIMPLDGRKWRSIEYAGGVYASEKTANDAVYQIGLKIVYEEMG